MEQMFHKGFPDVYKILKKIGRGGTADIYLAKHEACARPIILKQFYVPSAKSLIDRELNTAGNFNFPGIVRLHRSGKMTDDSHFLQLEYCDGHTLDQLAGKITERKLLTILSAVSATLCVVHNAGYAHNDLKPSNIFCPPGFDNDDFPIHMLHYLKLADFSLAESFGDGTPNVTGTVGYMSPEMILKKNVSASSDLFSLGVMAYYLACNKLPFESPSRDPLEINAKITEGERPELCGSGKSFSKQTADLINSLLEIDPGRRPQSAFSLLEILSRLGSPYPYRQAIRPRHLLNCHKSLDASTLLGIFGRDSFSPRQIGFIERTTSFHPPHVRILLEHNFDRGNFARLDGRWGWKSELPDTIDWSSRQIKFSLRELRGKPVSIKLLSLALAVAGNPGFAELMAPSICDSSDGLIEAWRSIPSHDHTSMLHSLNLVMHPSTRRNLSSRLVGLFEDSEENDDLIGKLLYNAGQYEKAIDYLMRAVDRSQGLSDHEKSFALLDVALRSAEEISDLPQQASILLKRALFEKEQGLLQLSENSFDSVIALIKGTEHKAILAKAYIGLGDLYKTKSDYQEGIRALNSSLTLYQELGDQLGLSHAYNNLGNMHWIDRKLDSALEHYQKALEIQRKLKADKNIGTSLNNIGSIYLVKGEYGPALSYLNQALNILEKLEDKGDIARSCNNLGVTQIFMGNSVEALEAFKRAYHYNCEIGARVEKLMNIENLTEAMIQAGRLTEALGYLKEGANQAEELEDRPHQSIFARLTGQLQLRLGFYSDAEKNLIKGLEIATQLENKAILLPCHLYLARLYLTLKETESARKYIELGQNIAESIGDKNTLFHIILIRLQSTGEDRFKTQARELLANLNTPREEALLGLALLEQNNRNETIDGSEDHLKSAGRFFSDKIEDIDQARFHLASGDYFFHCDNGRLSDENFTKAATLAEKYGLLPEQWQAVCSLSELTFKQGDFESSFRYSNRTQELLKSIAVKLKDSERLGKFYNDHKITGLLGRIKSLQKVLGKSKGAAVGSP
jgi:serine/threonine protein kinase/Tfp pilus assembly protein PilF